MSRIPLVLSILLTLQGGTALAVSPPRVFAPAPQAPATHPSHRPPPLDPFGHPEGGMSGSGRLLHAFLHHAARVMGTSSQDLQAEVLRRGLPDTLTAHGLTEESLVEGMTRDIVARSRARGQSVDEAKTRDFLRQIYKSLIMPPKEGRNS